MGSKGAVSVRAKEDRSQFFHLFFCYFFFQTTHIMTWSPSVTSCGYVVSDIPLLPRFMVHWTLWQNMIEKRWRRKKRKTKLPFFFFFSLTAISLVWETEFCTMDDAHYLSREFLYDIFSCWYRSLLVIIAFLRIQDIWIALIRKILSRNCIDSRMRNETTTKKTHRILVTAVGCVR